MSGLAKQFSTMKHEAKRAKSACSTVTFSGQQILDVFDALEAVQRDRAELSDKLNGTPCAEIRWRQERDALAAERDEAIARMDWNASLFDAAEARCDALAAALKGAETALLTARTKAIPAGAAFARRAEGKEEFVVEVLDAIDAALAQIKAALGETG